MQPTPISIARAQRALAIAAGAAAALTLQSATAHGQLLQRRFDPSYNAPWQAAPLGESSTVGAGVPSYDPRQFAVDSAGTVWLLAKEPVDGAPLGGAVLGLNAGKAIALGGRIADDPAAILASPTRGLLVATKGKLASGGAQVLQWQNDAWQPMLKQGIDAELAAMAEHDGVLLAASKLSGVFAVDQGVAKRIGATTQVLAEGFEWSQLQGMSSEQEDLALDVTNPAAPSLVAIGKDHRVRRWSGSSWQEVGNVCEASWDSAGLPVKLARELKAVALSPSGEVVVGTKGLAGSAEGKDVGAVWRWDSQGAAWQRLGQAASLKKEVKRLVWSPHGLLAQTNEAGLWRWQGETWQPMNTGLPLVAGKLKPEGLTVGPQGSVYVASDNALYRWEGAGPWKEVAFFSKGEEIKAIFAGSQGVWLGCKVGVQQGAVYQWLGQDLVQIGPDLARDVKQLTLTSDGTPMAVLGGGQGALRWTGAAWEPITGALSGFAAHFKALAVEPQGTFVAATQAGVWRGVWRKQAQTVVSHALHNQEIVAMAPLSGQLYVVSKQGAVWRRVPQAGSDDGQGWSPAAVGMPKVELQGAQVLDGALWLLGKQLLYRGLPGPDGNLAVQAVGSNPGAATLDGNGKVIWTGETAFLGVARDPQGQLWAATKDGLFRSASEGSTWQLFNGPGEVKALTFLGAELHAAVKEEFSEGGVTVKAASWWRRDLNVPTAQPVSTSSEPAEPDAGIACSSGRAGARGGPAMGLALAAAVAVALRRRTARLARN